MAGSLHLFKISGKLMIDKVKLNKHYIWDVLEINWREVKVTFNGKVINLPNSITVKLITINNWFTLTQEEPWSYILSLNRKGSDECHIHNTQHTRG